MGRSKNQTSRRRFLQEYHRDLSSNGFSSISENVSEDNPCNFDSHSFSNFNLESQEQTIYFRGASYSRVSLGSKFLRYGRIHKSKALSRHFDIQTMSYSASTSSTAFSTSSKRRKFGKCHHPCDALALCTNAFSNMQNGGHFVRDIGMLAKSISPLYTLIDGKFRLFNGQNLENDDNLTSSSSRVIDPFLISDEPIKSNPLGLCLTHHRSQFIASKAALNCYTVDDLSHLLSKATNFSTRHPPAFSVVTLNDDLSACSISPLSTAHEPTTTVATVSDADDDGSSAAISATVRPFERAFAALTVADAKGTMTDVRDSLVTNSSRLSSMLTNFQDLSLSGSQMPCSKQNSSFADDAQHNLTAYQDDLCKKFSTLPLSEGYVSTILQRTSRNSRQLGSDLSVGVIPSSTSPFHS